jgi:hypothetical protein
MYKTVCTSREFKSCLLQDNTFFRPKLFEQNYWNKTTLKTLEHTKDVKVVSTEFIYVSQDHLEYKSMFCSSEYQKYVLLIPDTSAQKSDHISLIFFFLPVLPFHMWRIYPWANIDHGLAFWEFHQKFQIYFLASDHIIKLSILPRPVPLWACVPISSIGVYVVGQCLIGRLCLLLTPHSESKPGKVYRWLLVIV